MKRIISLLSAILLIFALPLFASAEGEVYGIYLDDRADLFDNYYELAIANKLKELSEKLSVNYAVVTEKKEALGKKSVVDHAEDIYDSEFGKRSEGILIMIVPDYDSDGDYRHIVVSGKYDGAFEENMSEIIDVYLYGYLKGGYGKAVLYTLSESAKIYEEYRESYGMNIWQAIIIGLVIGAIVAFLVTNSMKNKLKTIKMQKNADNYVTPGSMRVDVSKDIYLYSTVTRVRRQTETHSSGGGGGGGGHHGGGRF